MTPRDEQRLRELRRLTQGYLYGFIVGYLCGRAGRTVRGWSRGR
jgi:hypothetical protein